MFLFDVFIDCSVAFILPIKFEIIHKRRTLKLVGDLNKQAEETYQKRMPGRKVGWQLCGSWALRLCGYL